MSACQLALDAEADHQKFKKQRHKLKKMGVVVEVSKKKIGELEAFHDLQKPKLVQ